MLTKCISSAVTYFICNEHVYMVFIRTKKVAVIAEKIWIMFLFPFKTKEHAYQHEIPQSILMFDLKKFHQLYPFTKDSITVSNIILIMNDSVLIKCVNLFNNKKGGITSKLSANMYIYTFVFNNAISRSGKR